MATALYVGAGLGGAFCTSPAAAHSFGPVYTLPLPFWMYAWGAAATVLLSFVLAGLLLRPGASSGMDRIVEGWRLPWPRRGRPRFDTSHDTDRAAATSPPGRSTGAIIALRCARIVGVLLLALCVGAGFVGTPYSPANISMTLFWVLFVVGVFYLVALLGDGYAPVNPWHTLGRLAERMLRPHRPGPVASTATVPATGNEWPAVFLLLLFVGWELFGRVNPPKLATGLSLYSVLLVAGSVIFGTRVWIQRAEIFGRICHLLGSQSLLVRRPHGWYLRPPMLGAEQLPRPSLALTLFLLAWLATTAFDGLHQTVLYHRWYFTDAHRLLLHTWSGEGLRAAYPWMQQHLIYWHLLGLTLMPLLYAAVYATCLGVGRWLAGGGPGVVEQMRTLAPSLIPIALVYHAAHYAPLLQTQGVKIVALISDPFGWGWNLFGTARWMQRTIIPDVSDVWRMQLALIILGHVAGVIVAHRLALRLYGHSRGALLNQLPMLVWMIGLTVFGLWVLSLPTVNTR